MKAAEYNSLIPITEMAEFLGYVNNPRKGKAKARWVVYDKFSDGKKDHSIVINRVRNTYFCKETQEHGSLVQFVKNRVREFPAWKPYTGEALDAAWEETKRVLDDYLGPGTHLGITPSLPDVALRNFRLSDYDVYFPSPNRAKFQRFLLERRNISEETIALFLKHKAIAHVKDKTIEFAYSNYGFPMRIPGEKEIVNFELRNYNSKKGLSFKGFCPGGNKTDALWIVPFVEPGNVTDVYVFESAIDALSFCDLVHPSPTSAIVSCGGYMTFGGISRLPGIFPSAQFHSCCDNDTAGNLYDVMLAYYLKGIHIHACQLDVRQENGSWNRNVQISFPDKPPVLLPADTFSGRGFLSSVGMNSVIIRHCAPQFKDWNEHLCTHVSNRTNQTVQTNRHPTHENP